MNISKANLNQLIALDALLTERNVTRAGEKLFITQSAMSNILKQLREVFNDELLVMNGRVMQLTLRAQELYPQIKHLLAQAEMIFKSKPFDPLTCRRQFVLGMEEYANYVLLPSLYAHLCKVAPHVQLHVKHVPFFEDKAMLETEEVDLTIGLYQSPEAFKTIHHELLFSENLVCIARKNHPLFSKSLTIESYLSAKHVSLILNQKYKTFSLDELLAREGYTRQVVLRLPHIVPALYALEKSDLVATVPLGVAKEAARLLKMTIQPCPIKLPAIAFMQAWHPLTHNDTGYQWLRGVVKHVTKKIKQ